MVNESHLPLGLIGARGFVGKAIAEQLQIAQLPFKPFYRSQINISQRAAEDGIFKGLHCLIVAAGISQVTRDNLQEARSFAREGSEWLIRKAAQEGVNRIVLISSCKAGREFGDSITERDEDKPFSDYGILKLEQERTVRLTCESLGIGWTILRPALVYGVGVKGNIREWIVRARKPWFPVPPAAGVRSMISVTDLAQAVLLAATSKNAHGKVFYVADSQAYAPITVDAVIRKAWGAKQGWQFPSAFWKGVALCGEVLSKTGINTSWSRARVTALNENAIYSSEHLQECLGWRPSQTFYSELPKMMASLDS